MCDGPITNTSSETVGRVAIRLHKNIGAGDTLRFSGGGRTYTVRVEQVREAGDEYGDVDRISTSTATSRCRDPGCPCNSRTAS